MIALPNLYEFDSSLQRRLDDIRASHGFAQLHWQVKSMHHERLLHAFTQTPRSTRIEIHQFAMHRVQRLSASEY
jgi:hypothetical protein